MKRIISFVILAVLFFVILGMPATQSQPHSYRPFPVWSVVGYLITVCAAVLAVWAETRPHREATDISAAQTAS